MRFSSFSLEGVSFDFLKTAIESMLAPEISRTELDAMTDQLKAVKIIFR